MMYEVNECCDCAVPGYPCLGSACSNRHVIYFKCDICGEDYLTENEMYDEDICLECYNAENEDDSED